MGKACHYCNRNTLRCAQRGRNLRVYGGYVGEQTCRRGLSARSSSCETARKSASNRTILPEYPEVILAGYLYNDSKYSARTIQLDRFSFSIAPFMEHGFQECCLLSFFTNKEWPDSSFPSSSSFNLSSNNYISSIIPSLSTVLIFYHFCPGDSFSRRRIWENLLILKKYVSIFGYQSMKYLSKLISACQRNQQESPEPPNETGVIDTSIRFGIVGF